MNTPARTLDLLSLRPADLFAAGHRTFTCLASCIEAAKRGGLYPCVVNGANEEAVSLFLQDKLGISTCSTRWRRRWITLIWATTPSVEEVLEADQKARAFVRSGTENKFAIR